MLYFDRPLFSEQGVSSQNGATKADLGRAKRVVAQSPARICCCSPLDEASTPENRNSFLLKAMRGTPIWTQGNALREEHGVTMKMLAALQRFIAKVADLEESDTKDLEALIEFFEIYVDRYHHGKEEQVLFPALSRTRTAGIDSLVNTLSEDHRGARTSMEQIKSNAVTLHSSSEADRYEFSERVDLYVDFVRKHIRKENSELLPLIEANAFRY